MRRGACSGYHEGMPSTEWGSQPWSGGPPWVGNTRHPGPWGGVPRDPGRHRRVLRWVPVVVSAFVQLPGLIVTAVTGAEPLTTVAVALAFAASFVLLLSRRYPGPVVAGIAVLCLPALWLVHGPPVFMLPLAFAVVLGAVRGARVWVWATAAALAVAAAVVPWAFLASPWVIARGLGMVLFLCILAGVGESARGRRERYREMSRRIANQRASDTELERIRIARELHDVLAHSLSQISVQAGVGLHLFDSQPARARESLAAIKGTSSRALEEVRGVLGFLREDGEEATRTPGPGLDRLSALVASFDASGLTVTVRNELGTHLSTAVQLAIYRIVQESLTNASRHAAATRAEVRLQAVDDFSVVTVVDNGHGPAEGYRAGRGLLGMRERAELLGGTLEAAARDEGGGFRVQARIPSRIGQAGDDERRTP
jgi:signal transduction histidine kinase